MFSTKSPRGSKEQQEIIRKKAFNLFSKNWKNKDIIKALGVSHGAVSNWRKKYKELGKNAFKNQTRGVKSGTKGLLTPEQEKLIQKLIIDKEPNQLKLPFILWTRDAVRQLIEHELKIKIATRTVGTYLKKWGFTAQRPIKRAYRRNDKKVEKWLKDEYPSIKKQAKNRRSRNSLGRRNRMCFTTCKHKGLCPKGGNACTQTSDYKV